MRKARVRVERELRQRRREIEKTVSDLEDRRDTVAKNGTELANRVQERVVNETVTSTTPLALGSIERTMSSSTIDRRSSGSITPRRASRISSLTTTALIVAKAGAAPRRPA